MTFFNLLAKNKHFLNFQTTPLGRSVHYAPQQNRLDSFVKQTQFECDLCSTTAKL